jgi:hypothetical protein
MSALCQKRGIHSITFSARASTNEAMVKPRAFEPFSRNEAPTARLYSQHDPLKARWMPHGPNSRRKPQPMTADGLMTAAQAATLKRLTQDAYELDAFKSNLTRTEADIRIAMLTAKLKLLDEPPHTL